MTALPDYSAQGFTDIKVTLDGPVLTILIDRPQSKNIFVAGIGKQIIHAFDLADKDDRVRAVIMTADPTAFAYCSGADLSKGWDVLWEEEAEKEGEHAHRDEGGTMSIAIMNCRKITTAAINGNAVGVGVTAFQLPFDFRFAWSGAKLNFPFVARGIVPEAASTFMLPRLLGHSRANSLLLTGQTVTPEHPHIRDLYHATFPTRAEVYPAAKAFALDLASRTSMTSVAFTKALLLHPGATIEENHLLDSRGVRILGVSKDAAEGARAFKEKRAPRFTDTLGESKTAWYPWWPTVNIAHRKTKL